MHISNLENRRVNKVEDVCNVGDTITVKYLGVDEKGRMNLSRKDALPPEPESARRPDAKATSAAGRGDKSSYRPRRPFRKPRTPKQD